MPYIVKVSSAAMPSKCWGKYEKIAVLEVDEGVTQVAQISTHCKEVRRIVYCTAPQFAGTSDRCAARKALEQARLDAAWYNLRDEKEAAARRKGWIVHRSANLSGDILSVQKMKGGVITRYDENGKKTGVAIKTRNGYEHGLTRQQCRNELRHKKAVALAAKVAKENAALVENALPIALELMTDLVVDFNTARSVGLCEQGIKAFCLRHRFDVTRGATVGEIIATGNADGIKACRKAVEKEILAVLQ